jgi:hypothetical protein
MDERDREERARRIVRGERWKRDMELAYDEGRLVIVDGEAVLVEDEPIPYPAVETKAAPFVDTRTEYTSFSLPPDLKSRDRFHRLVKACPGAVRIGRQWKVSRSAWEAHRAKDRTANEVQADPAAVARTLARLGR